MSGKPMPEGRREGRATQGSREVGVESRAHLLDMRVRRQRRAHRLPRQTEKMFQRRTEVLLVAAGRGRQHVERTKF